jgi:hypothetical protein
LIINLFNSILVQKNHSTSHLVRKMHMEHSFQTGKTENGQICINQSVLFQFRKINYPEEVILILNPSSVISVRKIHSNNNLVREMHMERSFKTEKCQFWRYPLKPCIYFYMFRNFRNYPSRIKGIDGIIHIILE